MTIEITDFGQLGDQTVREAHLTSDAAELRILNYGCVIRDWRVPVSGDWRCVTLGFENFDDYPAHSRQFGAVVGRVINRIKDGRFTLGGQTYQLPRGAKGYHSHGGRGLSRRIWDMAADGDVLRLSYRSPDGEDGYPGHVDFAVSYRLDGARLICEMQGTPDRPTPINMGHHAYFNLGGPVPDHVVTIDADRHTVNEPSLLPTGEIRSLVGGPFDFAAPRAMRDEAGEPLACDLNLVLRQGRDPARPAAVVRAPSGDLTLRLWTEEPAVQLFNAATIDIDVPGLDGQRYGPFCGFCLEAQHFPDSVNHPNFPSIIRSPENPYHQVWTIEISASDA